MEERSDGQINRKTKYSLKTVLLCNSIQTTASGWTCYVWSILTSQLAPSQKGHRKIYMEKIKLFCSTLLDPGAVGFFPHNFIIDGKLEIKTLNLFSLMKTVKQIHCFWKLSIYLYDGFLLIFVSYILLFTLRFCSSNELQQSNSWVLVSSAWEEIIPQTTDPPCKQLFKSTWTIHLHHCGGNNRSGESAALANEHA